MSAVVDMVFPYDGRFFNTHHIFKNIFEKTQDIYVFEKNTGRFNLSYGNHSVGGAFLANKNAYIKAGMENENFYGWGTEDIERIKRWEILGHKIHRTPGALFHLYHPGIQNGSYANLEIKKQNISEYLKICAYTPIQLKIISRTGQNKDNIFKITKCFI